MPRTQMTHILEALTRKTEAQLPKKGVSGVLGTYILYIIHILYAYINYMRQHVFVSRILDTSRSSTRKLGHLPEDASFEIS